MGNLLRKPLPWIVVSECAIVAALAMVAWHMVASPPSPHLSGAEAASPTAQAREAAAPVSNPIAGESLADVSRLLPGLNVDPGFWRSRLADLNRGESTFEQLEWKLVHSAMDGARRYVKSVVMPAIARAERGGR